MAEDNRLINGQGINSIVINGWFFCQDHGLEWCPNCTVDHRMTNNVQLEGELTEHQMEMLTDYGIEDINKRGQVVVTRLWRQLPGGAVACEQHSAVGCNSCFNFRQQIIDRIPALEAEINADLAAFHAQRRQQQH